MHILQNCLLNILYEVFQCIYYKIAISGKINLLVFKVGVETGCAQDKLE